MAESNKSPFEVTDYSGGITDDVFNQDYTKAQEIDNLFITSDRKLYSRPGSVIDDLDDGQIPNGVERIGTLINYANSDKLFVQSLTNFFYRDPSNYTELVGPTTNEVLSTGNETNAVSYSMWNRHLFVTSDAFPRPQKIYKDDNGDYQVRTSGLPALATDPIVTAGAAGANSYVYAFHYEYTYMVNDQTFQDVGTVTFVSLENAAAPDMNAVPITAIPVIDNLAGDNWDTSVIKVFIFRTINNGDTFYKIGEITNGTTIFNDNQSDATIQDNELLYTDDGTLDFDPVPESKFIHVVNNIGYYGHIKDGAEIFPYRIRQSVPFDPDSCPEDFFVDLEDEITGVGSLKSIPLVFCKRHIYRLENNFDRFGRGDINPVRISDHAGCISNLSIVQAENHCFWAGNDGFYATDGYQVIKISDGNNDRYKGLLEAQMVDKFIYGKFDELNRRVGWALQETASSLDNDKIAFLDLRWGVKTDSVFTTWSGNSFMPTALEFFNGQLYRADTRGYVFIHDPDYTTDPKVDINEDVEDWCEETIIWDYKSVNINFGSTFFRKMPTRILFTGGNAGNTSIQIIAYNNSNKIQRNLKPIRWRNNFVWGDEEFVWGNTECIWNSIDMIEEWRRFPAKGLRLSYVQIEITNAFSIVTISDTLGTATFETAFNTVTLDNPLKSWPSQSVDYFIATEADDYVREFQVTARNSDTVITINDAGSLMPTGTLKWVLRGYKKGEPLHLLSYNIFWENIDQNQTTFEAGGDGGNT